MRATTPKVRLIGRPSLIWSEIKDYLQSVDGTEWSDRIVSGEYISDAEALSEFGGRLCYRSWKPGLNANVTKVREDSGEYLRNVVMSGHGSVFEHAMYNFVLQDVSRVLTHELVRHRVGVGISQESMRYVRLTDLPFELPEFVREDPELELAATDLLTRMEGFQRLAADATGIDEPGMPFHQKKQITSAMRRFAPDGLATTVLWSANLRTLRQVIEARTADGAEEEIRRVFSDVGRIMQEEAPLIFGDFTVNEKGEWVPERSKI